MNTARDPGRFLEGFRAYLSLIARVQLDRRLQGKVDLSGIVQQTLLEAHQAFERFSTMTPEGQAAWLRKALACNLTDEIRKLGTARRNIGREQSLEQALEQSSARLEAWLATDQSSPSNQAVHNEQLLHLAAALEQLPEDQRRAVEMHHLRGESVRAVAEALGRGEGAAGALLARGLKRLRELLRTED